MGLSRQEEWSGVPLPSLAINKTAWGLYKDPKPCVLQSALPRASPAELPTLKAIAQTRELGGPSSRRPSARPRPRTVVSGQSRGGACQHQTCPNPTPPGIEGRGFQRRSASKAHSAAREQCNSGQSTAALQASASSSLKTGVIKVQEEGTRLGRGGVQHVIWLL